MALRKRLFYRPKQPLLPCKTYAFTTQNNSFYNALITSKLHNSRACEKYLHYSCLFSAHKISCFHKISTLPQVCFNEKKWLAKHDYGTNIVPLSIEDNNINHTLYNIWRKRKHPSCCSQDTSEAERQHS
ncbi:hypothetical protein CTM45_11055 [Prevotella intermedia]|uniref:Uncharacterized protein n=1 Tax=Prevotella intermedia TaxID=28131 RepID=A0A2D3LN02_PREIN|nr:hypothetical protein CTM46_10625 [Prevotella intermedia]PJI21350.1 hypothetical protein CTM45_11055 [Prevotella intermedia]